jgi:hypothetical protein
MALPGRLPPGGLARAQGQGIGPTRGPKSQPPIAAWIERLANAGQMRMSQPRPSLRGGGLRAWRRRALWVPYWLT